MHWWALPGVRKCAPLKQGILHLWKVVCGYWSVFGGLSFEEGILLSLMVLYGLWAPFSGF